MIDSDPALFIKSLFLALLSVPFFKHIWLSRCQNLENCFWSLSPSPSIFGIYQVPFISLGRELTARLGVCCTSSKDRDGDRAAPITTPSALPGSGPLQAQVRSCHLSVSHSRVSGLQLLVW